MNLSPAIPKDLVAYLDELYSRAAMAPKEDDSERRIWIKVGKRELVDTLLQMRKDQESGADQGSPNVFVSAASDSGPLDPGPEPFAGSGAPSSGPFASPQDRLR